MLTKKFRLRQCIRWGRNGTADGKYSTYDVLGEAGEGQAASFKKTVTCMVNYLCTVLNYANTIGAEIVTTDLKRKVRRTLVELKGEKLARAKEVWTYAWDRMLKLTVDKTVSPESLALLDGGDPTLGVAFKKTKIFDLLCFKDAASGRNGGKMQLAENHAKGFCEKQLSGSVDDIVKYAQAACRLGRIPTTESFTYVMTPRELKSIGVTPGDHEVHICTERIVDAPGTHGLATRAAAAIARVDSSEFYTWNVHFPLYRLLLLTRPKGRLMETTESSGKAAKARKNGALYDQAKLLCESSDALDNDKRVHEGVHDDYCLHFADIKKQESDRLSNADKKVGVPRKAAIGRMRIMGDPRWPGQVRFTKALVKHNAINLIMSLIRPKEVEMCFNVLRGVNGRNIVDGMLTDLYHNREIKMDEFHLMPDKYKNEIRAIVKRLKPVVTRKDGGAV